MTTDATRPPGSPTPRWDGRRVLFDVVQEDGRRVPCAISLTALQDLAGLRRSRPADLLACFVATRERIEAIALHKLRARRSSSAGVLSIWSEDLDPPPAEAAAAQPRDGAQPRPD